MSAERCDIGLIGLAVMGENLALNIESRGFSVCVHNRTLSKIQTFLEGRGRGRRFTAASSLETFVEMLKRPRKIFMLVKAGQAVDDLVEQLVTFLEPGDILIDGGNSRVADTIRRTREIEAKGLLYVGTGISGGEEGALRGPALMPGGSAEAWPQVRPIFESICARTPDGAPCCDWMGADGAGHFVKMIHNGIEYGDMQLICEAYDLMKRGLGMSNTEMASIFAEWSSGELDSYLAEITRDIIAHRDENGRETLDFILDAAGQKGTGQWAVSSALEHGVPLTMIGEAVFGRYLSSAKEERVAAAQVAPGVGETVEDKDRVLGNLRQALYAAKIVNYAQAFRLLRAAAKSNEWDLNLGGVALTWREGCIIRSALLARIKEAFDRDSDLVNLLMDPLFKDAVESRQSAWRKTLVTAVEAGIPAPCLSSALAYWDGYRSANLPANLLQAQRDYFGSHQYERIDRPRGELFHTNWTARDGSGASRR